MMSLHCKRAAQNWKAWRKPGARGWDHGETGRETGDWGTVIGAEADGVVGPGMTWQYEAAKHLT